MDYERCPVPTDRFSEEQILAMQAKPLGTTRTCEQMQEDICSILDGRSDPETVDLICQLIVDCFNRPRIQEASKSIYPHTEGCPSPTSRTREYWKKSAKSLKIIVDSDDIYGIIKV